MASSDVILCGICDAQHASHGADYWCPECDEGLCSTCKNHHGVSKASRKHGIISIDDYKKLPAEICKIEQNCTEHDKKFQMFCPGHDKLCCIICISENHKECTGMFLIDDVIKSSISSIMFESLEKSLKDIKENIERVVKDRKANLVEIKQQHLKSMNNIKDTRQKINSRLDELEQHMIDNLNSTETQLKFKIKTLLNKLSEKKNEIEILKINLMSVKQHGSDLQAFIGSKMLEKDVTEELKYVQNISEDDGFSQFGLKCQMDDKITDILSKIIAFGSVSIKSSQSSIVFTVDQEKQAQMFTVNPTRSRPVDDITASFVGEFKVPAGNTTQFVTGSSVFPDGRMIFAECFNDNRLVIVCNDSRLVTEIPFSPRSPFDVTCIDNNTVAVTTYRDNTIMVVDTQNKQISKTIMSDEYRGITFNQGHILYCSKGKGIVAIQLSNYTVCTIVEDCKMTNDCSYIKTFEKNIYYTGNANTVKCYSIMGVKLWEYKDDSFLLSPCGIAVDQCGIVYVMSNTNTSVISLSLDGKNGRTLLTAKDGIGSSYGIIFFTNKHIECCKA